MDHNLYYSPLASDNSFRLIHLSSGTESDPISVRLFQSEIGSAPEYDALSYVWGDPSNTKAIFCDSKLLNITVNLYWALSRVREPHRNVILWTDAICIDQLNVQERSRQVAHMGLIYGNANTVFLAMGEAPDSGAKSVASLVQGISLLWGSEIPSLSSWDPLRHDPRWRSLSILMDCPWFTRAWVSQEAGLAKNPVAMYGDSKISYRNLLCVVLWVQGQVWGIKFGIHTLMIHTHWPDWNRPAGNNSWRFFDLLSHGAMLTCEDPRDRVYSFLGHPLARVQNELSTLIIPDYSKGYLEVYTEISVLLLQDVGLRLLSAVEHTESTIEEPLPSWIVRWNISGVMNEILRHPGQYQASPQSASGHVSNVVLNQKLVSRGIVLDTIETSYRMRGNFTRIVHDGGIVFSNVVSGRGVTVGAMIKGVSSTFGIYGIGSEQRNAFLRTISAGDLKGLIPKLVSHNEEEYALSFQAEVNAVCSNRCFAVTKSGFFVLAPWLAQPGDVCCVLFGADVPFVLRPTIQERHYRFLGEAYIDGIMNGQVQDMCNQSQLEGQEIIII